jgi:ATP phosphoribosyltransferase regulatory subunit
MGQLQTLFQQAGARWLDVPVLHPADSFLETAGEDIRRRMFVTEGRTGERLALRPDFTIPVCLEHLRNGAASGRYAYEGVVFRRHDTGSPERLETGYEDIGRADRVDADAEALALAVAGVSAVAPGPLTVRLGDIGLFAALLTALGLPEPWRRRLRRSFGLASVMEANLLRLSSPREADDVRLDPDIRAAAERHDRYALAALLAERLTSKGHAEGEGRGPAEIADRFLDQRSLAETHIEANALATLRAFLALRTELAGAPEVLRAFAADHGVDFGAALEEFAARAAAIAALAPAAAIAFEAGFGRPLDYYTGLVFEIRANASPEPISGGGRYDRLMEMLGAARPVPAIGFMIRLDLAEASP